MKLPGAGAGKGYKCASNGTDAGVEWVSLGGK